MNDLVKVFLALLVILVIYYVYTNYKSNEKFAPLSKIFDQFTNNSTDSQVEKMHKPKRSKKNRQCGGANVEVESSKQMDSVTKQIDSDSNSVLDPDEIAKIKKKMQSKDVATSGQYKAANYAKGQRPSNNMNEIEPNLSGNSEWDKYFNNISDIGFDNDNFNPLDDKTDLAQPLNKLSARTRDRDLEDPKELFNVDKLLPKETRDDWFDVIPDPISVANRHLISVSRPVGVNSIGTSLKNASWDIRGTPPNPRQAISPWLNSSIEPDYNIKGLC